MKRRRTSISEHPKEGLFSTYFIPDAFNILVRFLDANSCHRLRFVCKRTHVIIHNIMKRLDKSFWTFSFEDRQMEIFQKMLLPEIATIDMKIFRRNMADSKSPSLHDELTQLIQHANEYNKQETSVLTFKFLPIIALDVPSKWRSFPKIASKSSFLSFRGNMERYWNVTILKYFKKYYSCLWENNSDKEKPEIYLFVHLDVARICVPDDTTVQLHIAYKKMNGVKRIQYEYPEE